MKYRPRWWNIGVFIFSILYLFVLLLSCFRADYREGFVGNIVSGLWTILVGLFISWIALLRFRYERFKNSQRFYSKHIENLMEIADEFRKFLKVEPKLLKTVFNDEIKTRLLRGSEELLNKAMLYNRFLEIQELESIDKCCMSARTLAYLDNNLSDISFMYYFTLNFRQLFIYTSDILNKVIDEEELNQLMEIYKYWSSQKAHEGKA